MNMSTYSMARKGNNLQIMVALSIFYYIIWVCGDIIIKSYTHFYCIYVNLSDQTLYNMSECQQSQFEKLKLMSYLKDPSNLKIYNKNFKKQKR